jgi:hypothetical protein
MVHACSSLLVTVVLVVLCILGFQLFVEHVFLWHPQGWAKLLCNIVIAALVISRRHP